MRPAFAVPKRTRSKSPVKKKHQAALETKPGRQRPPAEHAPQEQAQPELNAAELLYWQHAVGNQAVQRSLLQRAPQEGEAPEKDAARDAELKRPDFFRASPLRALPGDLVPETAGWLPPYTQQNRQFLLDQLLKRNEANVRNGMNFASRFSGAYLRIWSNYVVDQMADAAESNSSFWGEMATFLGKAVIVAIMTVPVLGELEEAGIAFEEFYKKTTEFSVELAVSQGKEKEAQGKVAQRKQRMESETDKIADQFSAELIQILLPLTGGFYYTEWLEEASLEDLPKFRLPPLIPDRSLEEIEAAVAQSIGGFLTAQEEVDEDQHSLIQMAFSDAPAASGMVSVEQAPVYQGPEFIGRHLLGQSLQFMPNIPLKITQTNDLSFVMQDVIRKNGTFNPADLAAFADIAAAWPFKSPLIIERDVDGTIQWHDGGLAEMLYFYLMAHPEENVYQTLTQAALGMDEQATEAVFTDDPTTEQATCAADPSSEVCYGPQVQVLPPYTRANAASDLYVHFLQGTEEGVKQMLNKHIPRLTVQEIKEND